MEKKKKLTHEEELAKRKWKKTWLPFYLIYYVATKLIIQRPFRPKIIKKDKLPKKGAAIIIYNHLSRLDHSLFMDAAWPRRINILAGYTEFFRSHLHWAFKHNQVIPKKIYTNDFISLKAMKSIIKDKKGVVAFSPEGTSSIHGNGQPIVPGTAHFLKHYGVPVYFLNINGSYLIQNKVDNSIRKGKTECLLELMFTPDDLANLSNDEITDRINEKMRHDDYEWEKEKHYKYVQRDKAIGMAKNLSDILYRCPKCNSLFTTKDEMDDIYCSKCGNRVSINNYYEMIPTEGSITFDTPTKWVDFERMEVIKEIRSNPDFVFECNVTLGTIPKYEWLKNYATSYKVGEGVFRVDHTGVSYKGTKDGEEYNIHLNYKEVYTFGFETDLKQFDIYVKGELHEFTPTDSRYSDYLLHLVQEMHRLHVNSFKNFKWNEYMYQEK
ncbi:MAG: 1-acyl-sn-glycerol-3-phosphate acyltransferase [Gammaproteobacteria bacterium]|nr:1-acyl-sn-glycerol-3-phosphate acyltransferase [Gammaproteobacteria bacterium]